MEIVEILEKNGLVFAFVVIGLVMWVSYQLSDKLSAGRLHGSAIAIIIGLFLAWLGGTISGGSKGLADLTLFSGIGLMGGSMLRDLAIVSTAYGVDMREIRKAGPRASCRWPWGSSCPLRWGRWSRRPSAIPMRSAWPRSAAGPRPISWVR